MTEFIFKTTTPPPEGWEYTGEFRKVSNGDWYLHEGEAKNWVAPVFSTWCYPILRRKRWVPNIGDKYWFSPASGTISAFYDGCIWDKEKLKHGNCWRTEEQAIAYAKACRELAEKMHSELQT